MPPRWLKKRAPLAAVFFVLIAAAAALAAWRLLGTERGTAPELELTLLDGRMQPLSAWRGRVVLVDFWSLTCRPCLEQRAALAALYERLHPRGLEMVAIAMPYDPPLAVRDFQEKHPAPFPIALDVEARAARAFGADLVPLAVLIAPDGAILYRQAGTLDIGRVQRIIEPFLRPAAGP